MNKVIEIRELSISSKQGTIVEELSLDLEWGKPITILGETGSGKSLLAQALMGALPKGLFCKGEIKLFGKKMYSQAEIESLWGRELAMLPQEPWLALDPIMPVNKQVSLVNRLVGLADKSQSESMAQRALHKFGLKDDGHKVPSQLSGGMAQRVAYLCATAAGGRVLIADEPTKGLDSSRKQQLIRLLQQHSNDGALLTITHDVEVAEALGGDILVMRKGTVLERGPCRSVLNTPKSRYAESLISAHKAKPPKPTDNPNAKALIELVEIEKSRGGNTLFSDLGFTLHQGEVLGIVGDSGAGKSTLADILLGLVKSDKGRVVHHQRLGIPSMLKLYQDPPASFCKSITLGQNLNELCNLHNLDLNAIPSLMSELGLDAELLGRKADSVSGGELQRFAILRVLLMKPKILVADEPTSRLDPVVANSTIKLLLEQTARIGCALVLISHDLALVEQVSHKVIRVSDFTASSSVRGSLAQTTT